VCVPRGRSSSRRRRCLTSRPVRAPAPAELLRACPLNQGVSAPHGRLLWWPLEPPVGGHVLCVSAHAGRARWNASFLLGHGLIAELLQNLCRTAEGFTEASCPTALPHAPRRAVAEERAAGMLLAEGLRGRAGPAAAAAAAAELARAAARSLLAPLLGAACARLAACLRRAFEVAAEGPSAARGARRRPLRVRRSCCGRAALWARLRRDAQMTRAARSLPEVQLSATPRALRARGRLQGLVAPPRAVRMPVFATPLFELGGTGPVLRLTGCSLHRRVVSHAHVLAGRQAPHLAPGVWVWDTIAAQRCLQTQFAMHGARPGLRSAARGAPRQAARRRRCGRTWRSTRSCAPPSSASSAGWRRSAASWRARAPPVLQDGLLDASPERSLHHLLPPYTPPPPRPDKRAACACACSRCSCSVLC